METGLGVPIKATIVQLTHILPHRLWKAFPGSGSMLLGLMLPGAAVSKTPEFPAISVVRGMTRFGYPDLSGEGSFNGKRASERMTGPFNLKLILSRQSGLPARQVVVMVGTIRGHGVDQITVQQPWLYLSPPTHTRSWRGSKTESSSSKLCLYLTVATRRIFYAGINRPVEQQK